MSAKSTISLNYMHGYPNLFMQVVRASMPRNTTDGRRSSSRVGSNYSGSRERNQHEASVIWLTSVNHWLGVSMADAMQQSRRLEKETCYLTASS